MAVRRRRGAGRIVLRVFGRRFGWGMVAVPRQPAGGGWLVVAGRGGGGRAGVLLGPRLVPPGAGSRGGQLGWGTGMVTEQPARSFAELLRQLRAKAKLTQEELAATAG